MEMTPDLSAALNRQVVLELEASLAYLQMSAHFEAASLPGMASWMRAQSEEEHAHALRFFDHVLDRGGSVVLGDIPAPRTDFESPADVFAAALDQERKVSAAVSDLYRLALTTGDVASLPLLQWFLEEQIEEEATVSEILDQVRMVGDDGAALLLLDRELGSRVAGGGDGA